MAEDNDKKEKKIIVDEDWKEQARKEKEILAAKEKAERQEAEQPKQRGHLPPGDFAALVSMLATQALFAIGAIVPEGREKPEPDLELAKYHIDMLEVLEQKTKGNLSQEEEKLLDGTLHQARMLYVKVSG